MKIYIELYVFILRLRADVHYDKIKNGDINPFIKTDNMSKIRSCLNKLFIYDVSYCIHLK